MKRMPTDELAQASLRRHQVTGNLVRVENGQMLIKPNSAEAANRVGTRRDAASALSATKDLPEDGHDRVYWDGGSLRGTLAGGDTARPRFSGVQLDAAQF